MKMKEIYILKNIVNGEIGYYDGAVNWSAQLSKAIRFDSYLEALDFLKDAIEVNGWGGYIQIEKYFINA